MIASVLDIFMGLQATWDQSVYQCYSGVQWILQALETTPQLRVLDVQRTKHIVHSNQGADYIAIWFLFRMAKTENLKSSSFSKELIFLLESRYIDVDNVPQVTSKFKVFLHCHNASFRFQVSSHM